MQEVYWLKQIFMVKVIFRGMPMKRVITTLVLLSVMTSTIAQTPSQEGYTSEGTRNVGNAVARGSNTAIGLSMFGWGIALAAAIAIIAACFQENESEQAH
jgi:hypothetical protein